jgi:isopenicillin N synthase-like dioxygenase
VSKFLKTLFVFFASFHLAYANEMDIRIPVVDMQDFYRAESRDKFLDTLYHALTTVGFFAVRNTGVDQKVIGSAYGEAKHFFKQPAEYKASCYVKELKGQRGFVPGETAKGNARKDSKEFYHIGRENFSVPNVWPEDSQFKDSMVTLFDELEKYVVPLQQAIISTINRHGCTSIPLDYLNDTTKNGDSLLRALYYPALTEEDLKTTHCWAAAHTDIDYLAILPYATEKGLQVEIGGEWMNVVVPEDAFIVNGGDMLENLTNGLFVSAKHRVAAQESGKERFSMVLFVHPTGDTKLDPLPECIQLTGGFQLYAPGTRNEFLWERLLELNIAPGLLPLYAQTGHTERQIQYGRESSQVVDLLIQNGLASKELFEALDARNP